MGDFWNSVGDFFIVVFKNGYFQALVMGIVVWYITRWFEQRKEKKEYVKQTTIASTEVFNCFKSIITDEDYPSIEILYSVHKATAKKYKVHPDDMASLQVIIDDLIKEVMDTSFLPYKDKMRYSNKIIELKKDIQLSETFELDYLQNNYFKTLVKSRRMGSKLSLIPTFSAVILVLTSTIFSATKTTQEINLFNDLSTYEYFMVAFTSILFLAATLSLISKLILERINKFTFNKDKDDEEKTA